MRSVLPRVLDFRNELLYSCCNMSVHTEDKVSSVLDGEIERMWAQKPPCHMYMEASISPSLTCPLRVPIIIPQIRQTNMGEVCM